MKKIALTGNMGCGKSYVANIIRSQKICVLDCDQVASKKRNEYQDELSQLFQVNASEPKAMASVVFADDQKKEQLENFLYPLIQEEIQSFFEEHQKEIVVVVEVPLLYEKGWENIFDEVWVVSCEEEVAIQRLIKQRKFSEKEIRERLKKQMPLQEKIQRADVVLYNDDTIIDQVLKRLQKEGVKNVETRE